MDYIEVQFTISPLEPAREILAAYLGEKSFDSFMDTDEGMTAYIAKDDWSEDGLKQVISSVGFAKVNYTFRVTEDQNWNATWESQFQPIDVDGRCYIRAPFHEPKEGVEFEIVISPQMSFGTGHHATTYQMVKAMLDLDMEGQEVLDMGAGTAILAVLAEKKGARKIDAIDVEEWAYRNALENAQLNDCSRIHVALGDVSLLPSEEKYDLVLANINRNVLLQDMQAYARCMKTGSLILFSGFFPSDTPLMEEEAKKTGLQLIQQNAHDGWAQLTFRKS